MSLFFGMEPSMAGLRGPSGFRDDAEIPSGVPCGPSRGVGKTISRRHVNRAGYTSGPGVLGSCLENGDWTLRSGNRSLIKAPQRLDPITQIRMAPEQSLQSASPAAVDPESGKLVRQ